MKITKNQLRRIIKEAFPVKGKAVGNFIKKGRAGRIITMQGREYTDLGKGHWQGPGGEKLNWVQLSSMASALGDEMVTIDNNPRISETKITKNQLRRIIKEEKARLLTEGVYLHEILDEAGKALSSRDGSRIESLASQVSDLMIGEDEKRAFENALYAMAEAAYELQSYEEG